MVCATNADNVKRRLFIQTLTNFGSENVKQAWPASRVMLDVGSNPARGYFPKIVQVAIKTVAFTAYCLYSKS